MSFWRKVHCWASRSFANLRDLRVICGWCVTSRYLTPRLGRCGVQWLRSVLKWNFNVYRCTEYRILYEMIWNEYVTWILSSWHKIGLLRKNLDVQTGKTLPFPRSQTFPAPRIPICSSGFPAVGPASPGISEWWGEENSHGYIYIYCIYTSICVCVY